MHCRRGMANQGFRSAQTDRQFEYLKAIEESERVRLISFDVEGECRAGELDCLSINFCVGWSAGSKGGAKTSALVFPQPRDGSDHRCSDTKPRADGATKWSHENVNSSRARNEPLRSES